jgi:leader peptidase (prepilin peptidase)/N-methyltransferase
VVGGVLAVGIGISLHGGASTLIGGAFGFGFMLAIYYLGFLFVRFTRRMRGLNLTEEDAIGFGDVNLTGIMGLLLGWPGIILGLVFAILLAGLGSLIYLIYKLIRGGYHPGIALPYGPFITASIFVLLYLDPQSWFS